MLLGKESFEKKIIAVAQQQKVFSEKAKVLFRTLNDASLFTQVLY